MSDLVIQSGGGSRPRARRFRLPWSWPLRRRLARLRQRLRAYRRQRQTQILLQRLNDRLLCDIGLEPLDLIEQQRRRTRQTTSR
jgi:uncharacterized protein YjiS (DUF1127 family)